MRLLYTVFFMLAALSLHAAAADAPSQNAALPAVVVPPSEAPSLAAPVEAALSQDELTALLDGLEKSLGGIKSLKTAFTQEKHVSIFSDVVTSHGLVFFQRPDKVRFEITEPFQSVTITDGKAVARYELVDGKWRRLDAGDAGVVLQVTSQIGAWLNGHLREKSDVYDISATGPNPATVILTPRDARFRKYISAIKLRLDARQERFESVTIAEPGGDFTTMTFTAEERDIDLPAGVFDISAQSPLMTRSAPGPAPTGKP